MMQRPEAFRLHLAVDNSRRAVTIGLCTGLPARGNEERLAGRLSDKLVN